MSNTFRWSHRGLNFVCYEYAEQYKNEAGLYRDPVTMEEAPLTHTVEAELPSGAREVGSAISLMDAHALSLIAARGLEQEKTNDEW